MKRVILMTTLFFLPRLLASADIDIHSLAGQDWYGLYFNGQKSGFAVLGLSIDDKGTVTMTESVHFKINQGGKPQSLSTFSERVYGHKGNLLSIRSRVTDASGTTTFTLKRKHGKLHLITEMAGRTSEEDIDSTKDNLKNALKEVALLEKNPQVNDSLTFCRFEPMFKRDISGKCTITGVETRILDGVSTRVYTIQTEEYMMGATIPSVSYVAENGKLLEGTVAGIIKMRLEPEAVAKDVHYNNDVIVSNAALLDKPLENARTRTSLHLQLSGPLNENLLFSDDRQTMKMEGDTILFSSHLLSLDGVKIPQLPVDAPPGINQYKKATTFVQSDDPKLIAKAKEIIGTERNSWKAAEKLCHWVYQNVETSYSARLTNALEVLEHPSGDCTEHSILFVGLARAAGIPAREVAGLIYVQSPQPGFYFHQWASVWVGKWIDMDPTFDQPMADVTHIKLAEGDLFEQARLIPIIGQIKVTVLP